MNTALICCIIAIVGCITSIGTLIYKYAQVVSRVFENEKDIENLKGLQEKYQSSIEKTLDEIKSCLNNMNTCLQVLTSRLDYLEKEGNK